MHPHTILIHNLAHATAALSASEQLKVPVSLISAPGAAAYLGAAVFRDIIGEAARACPGAVFSAILDCGEDAGLALGAIRNGIKRIRIDVPGEVKARIKDIAAQTGAILWEEDAEALDLLEANDAHETCRVWLARKEKS